MTKYTIVILTCLISTYICYGQNGWIKQESYTNSLLWGIQFLNSQTGYIVGERIPGQDTTLILKTTNSGENWIKLVVSYKSGSMCLYFLDVNNGYIGTKIDTLIKTTDGGVSWQLIKTTGIVAMTSVYFLNQQTGFACGPDRIVKTTNGGNNWNIVLNSNGVFSDMQFVNSNFAYALNGSAFFKSGTGGNTWSQIPNAPNGGEIEFLNENTGYMIRPGLDIKKTINGGNNWTTNFIGGSNTFYDIKFTCDDTGYVCGGYGLLMKTTNKGVNWLVQSLNFTETLVSMYFQNNNTGYIIGNNGLILKTTTGGQPIGVVQISSNVPSNYSLSQNYPNPFNPSTKIQFEIPKSSLVKLKILNTLGQVVKILVDQTLSYGKYETVWNADNCASGIYYYLLETGNVKLTKRMVLIK